MENSLVIEKLLNPISRQYKRNKIKSAIINSINDCMKVLLFWLVLLVFLKLLFADLKPYLDAANIVVFVGISVYFLVVVIMSAIDKIKSIETALVVDQITNPHDIVVSGLEYEITGRKSDFALFSISKACSILSDFEVTKVCIMARPLRYKMILMVLFLIVTYVLIPDHVALLNNNDFNADAALKTENQLSTDNIPGVLQNNKTDANQVARERSLFITANANSQTSAGDSNYITIGNQENSNAFAINQSLSRKMVSDNKVNEYQEDSFQMNSDKTASSSLSNLSESNVKTGDLFADTADQDNQLESDSNDKKEKGNNNSSGRSPMLDDNASAPGRELGRAGKKNGKPGNGRGGLGSVKKSRATASIMAGKPVPVFIKSRQNKGRSKSIILNSPPGRDIDRDMTLADGLEHESVIDKSVVSEEMETLVTNYFKELTEYANRKHESNTRQDK